MGLPSGWTAAAPLPAAEIKAHPISQWPVRKRQKTLSLFSGCGALDFALSRWCLPVQSLMLLQQLLRSLTDEF